MAATATAATTTAATATGATTTSAPDEPARGRSPRAAAAWSERLYAQHHRLVAGLCRGLLRNAAEAEDASQQVFLSAHRALLNGADPREPAAWLATIARNECWSRISTRMREPLPTDAADDVAAGDDPLDSALRRADLAALWRAIGGLPRQQRDALLLREFGGLRYDELATALSVTEPAVESLLFRARARLRSQLKTAYAAVAGASWLDPIARLVAGGGAPAVATKAVAVGLGAAAVTGTAVVVPKVAATHEHARPHPAIHVLTAPVAPEAVATPPVVLRAAPTTAKLPPATAPPARRRRSHEPEQSKQSGPGSEHASERGPGSGDRRSTTTQQEDRSGRGGGSNDVAAPAAVAVAPAAGGGSGSDSGSGSGPGSGSGDRSSGSGSGDSGGGSGDSGSGGGSDGSGGSGGSDGRGG